jgi:hypothetical protein
MDCAHAAEPVDLIDAVVDPRLHAVPNVKVSRFEIPPRAGA